jgi:hypothetical protein
LSASPASEFDPHASFIAEDGLEYENLAEYICGRPVDCWRNRTIQNWRQGGRSEAAVREWIKGYDGDDPTPSSKLDFAARADRQVRANFSVDSWGRPLCSTLCP